MLFWTQVVLLSVLFTEESISTNSISIHRACMLFRTQIVTPGIIENSPFPRHFYHCVGSLMHAQLIITIFPAAL